MNAENSPQVTEAPHVYTAMSAIQHAMSSEGIEKSHEPKDGIKFKFRGIDDVYSALASKLAVNGLLIIPRVTDRECREVTSSKGTLLIYTVVTVEYDFISTVDGSKHKCVVLGEAMDTGDKSTNKAMSAAYKYMALQSFCIPVHGESNDSEDDNDKIGNFKKPPAQRQDATGPVQMTKAQEAACDMEELVRQAANEHGFPGNTIFDSAAAKNKSLSELLKRLNSGTLKGPGGKE